MKIEVSIIIPTYNRVDYIEQTVQSALAQDFEDFEIIVIDDGSTDNTRELLAQFETFPNFHYVFQENNGRSSARNHGIRISKGAWLMFLDSDDTLPSNSLSTLFEAAMEQPDAHMIAGKTTFIDEKGESRGHPWDSTFVNPPRGFLKRPYLLALDSLIFTPGTYIVRADVVKSGIAFEKALEPAEDVDFMLRVAAKFNIYDFATVVHKYRVHGGNSDTTKQRFAVIAIADRHLVEIVPTLTANARSKAKGKLHLKAADIFYMMDMNRAALVRYVKCVLADPTRVSDLRILRQIAASLLPVGLKVKLRAH